MATRGEILSQSRHRATHSSSSATSPTSSNLSAGSHLASNELVLVFPAAFDLEETPPETAKEPIRLLTAILTDLKPRNISWKGMWITIECNQLVGAHRIPSLNTHLNTLIQSYPKYYGMFRNCCFMLKPMFELSRLWESISFVGEEIVSSTAEYTEITCYLRQMMSQIERVTGPTYLRRDLETIIRDQDQEEVPDDFDDSVPAVQFFQTQRRKFILKYQDEYNERDEQAARPPPPQHLHDTNGHTQHRNLDHTNGHEQLEQEEPSRYQHENGRGAALEHDRRKSISEWISEKRIAEDRMRGEETLNRARPEKIVPTQPLSPQDAQADKSSQPTSETSSVSSYFSSVPPKSTSSTSLSSNSVSTSSKWSSSKHEPILKPAPFSMSAALRKESFRSMLTGGLHDEKEHGMDGDSDVSDLEYETAYPTVTSPPDLDDFINGKFNITCDKVAAWMRLKERGDDNVERQCPRFIVCDTRTHDFVGGHIVGCFRTPYDGFEEGVAAYCREFRDKTDVIFHCMYSSYRGPRCAFYYWRYRRQFERANRSEPYQRIWVLENGFKRWLGEFVMDRRLVEDYAHVYWEEDFFPLTGREFFYVNDWKPPDE